MVRTSNEKADAFLGGSGAFPKRYHYEWVDTFREHTVVCEAHAAVEALSKTNVHLNRLLQQVMTSRKYIEDELFSLL